MRNLTFGRSFDQGIGIGVLSATLTHLIFGRQFDQALIPGVLNKGLQLACKDSFCITHDLPQLPEHVEIVITPEPD